MARFRIDATWRLEDEHPCVHLEFEKIARIAPSQHQRLLAVGILKADDEPVAREPLGALNILTLVDMTPKRVRKAALAWLAQYADMTPDDSYELHAATQDTRELLARIEAAVTSREDS